MSLILASAIATALAASTLILPIVVLASSSSSTTEEEERCGLWLAPSPIKEQEDHGWGHSIFTGKLIPKGTVVLGSGILDETKSEKVFGDLFIPVYDWESLDAGAYASMLQDNDDDAYSEDAHKARIQAEAGDDIDPPIFQELWNGAKYDNLVLESYESLRLFMPGLANIPPCSATGFNLGQVPRQITYRDWRDITKLGHDESPPSFQAGSFSYLSNAMFVAQRDIQPGEELVVECSDNSDEFDPKDYPPVNFKPKEAGGYSICLDDKAEERLADHTSNVAGGSHGGQRGLFAKRILKAGEIITSTPLTPVHRDEMIMDRKKYEQWNRQAEEQDHLKIPPKKQQLLLNYMFGHPASSLLWLPQAPLILAVNHASSYYDQNPKVVVQPNAKIQWHSDKYTEAQAAGTPLTRRQQFHHTELLEMDSLEVVQQQGMGLMLDLVATRTINEGEEILIDYGKAWDDAMKQHKVQWESTVDVIKLEHEQDKAMRKRQRKLEREREELKARSASGGGDTVRHKHRHKHMENSMTAIPLSSYVTASDYNELYKEDDVRTVMEQHRNPYPSNIETACYFGFDWLDEEDNGDEDAELVTYESWYNQEDEMFDPGCLLPCVITERRDYVPGEEDKQKQDDDDDDGSGYYKNEERKQTQSGNTRHNGGSAYPKRYTAKLIDTHEENTSIGFQCHIYKRFEYIYMDIPREGITFINKPHSTDHWIEQAFRQPIGLPDDMVPKIWKDLTRRKGMRGGNNVPKPKAALAKVITEKEEDAEKDYLLSVKRWNVVETRRERLEELDEKLQLTPRQDL